MPLPPLLTRDATGATAITMAASSDGVRDEFVAEFSEFEGMMQALMPLLKECVTRMHTYRGHTAAQQFATPQHTAPRYAILALRVEFVYMWPAVVNRDRRRTAYASAHASRSDTRPAGGLTPS
jgi:hypothetical protein